jgi:hypothetical protein
MSAPLMGEIIWFTDRHHRDKVTRSPNNTDFFDDTYKNTQEGQNHYPTIKWKLLKQLN